MTTAAGTKSTLTKSRRRKYDLTILCGFALVSFGTRSCHRLDTTLLTDVHYGQMKWQIIIAYCVDHVCHAANLLFCFKVRQLGHRISKSAAPVVSARQNLSKVGTMVS